MMSFTRYTAPTESSPSDFTFFDLFKSEVPKSPRSDNNLTKAYYASAANSVLPKRKFNRNAKNVGFSEDVRVRFIRQDPDEFEQSNAKSISAPVPIADHKQVDDDRSVSLSLSPPRKLQRSVSPPPHARSISPVSSSPLQIFSSSIFKAFETPSMGAVRCR